MKILNERVGYELCAKGADRVSAKSKQLAIFAEKLAKLTKAKKPLKEITKALKELQKWQVVVTMEINRLEDDIDNLEDFKK